MEIMILTTKEQIKELFAEIIKFEPEQVAKDSCQNNVDFLSKKDAANYLQVSTNTVDNYRRKNLIKSYKIGNNVRFKKSELIEAVEGKFSNRKTVTK